MKRWAWILLLLLGVSMAQTVGNQPPPDYPPEVFEIAKKLRCPVCRGESAAESNAGVTEEMRRQIAEMLKEGKSEEEIIQYFVDRYTDWILYEPPKKGLGLVVWLAPLIGLGIFGLGLYSYTRTTAKREAALEEVDDDEIARLEAELERGSEDGGRQ
ncbi:cytochrome c-type biogenesis protein [Oceanithermus sp.]